jgi:hypothetical protein
MGDLRPIGTIDFDLPREVVFRNLKNMVAVMGGRKFVLPPEKYKEAKEKFGDRIDEVFEPENLYAKAGNARLEKVARRHWLDNSEKRKRRK